MKELLGNGLLDKGYLGYGLVCNGLVDSGLLGYGLSGNRFFL